MQISVKSSGKYAALLRDAGFRATYGRVALLEALERAGKPLRVETAARKVAGKLDLTNTYRSLEALCEIGAVRRVDLGHAHTHYEFAHGRAHAHIPVAGLCRTCTCP